MKTLFSGMLLVVALGGLAGAGDSQAQTRIEKADLFKNGLAVLRIGISLPGPGRWTVPNLPTPVHGTFWFEEAPGVTAAFSRIEIDEPIPATTSTGSLDELVGATVTIHTSSPEPRRLTGTLLPPPPAPATAAWNRNYHRRNQYAFSRFSPATTSVPTPSPMLVLKTEAGRIYLRREHIDTIEAATVHATRKRREEVMVLTVPAARKGPVDVHVSCLSKGLSWVPSYRIDLVNERELTLEQKAVVKNELAPLSNAALSLISGFPSVPFAHVTSPLSPQTDWTTFFAELNQRVDEGHAATLNVIRQQAVRTRESAPEGLDLSATPRGEGVDLHYQSVGQHTLAEGSSLLLPVARAKAPYKRIVEWSIPDTRGPDGRHVQAYQRRQNPEEYQDEAWDAIRFRNPFPFPMTTAAATICTAGRFSGQRLSHWVNAGEETTLPITKALSIRTRCVETEQEGKRAIVWVGGDDYQKVGVKGQIDVSNHRNEAVTLIIRRRFSGELNHADDTPRSTLREEGVYSVNKRQELLWTLTLAPGEQKDLTYAYSVLVNR